MPDSDAVRARRYRQHQQGNHESCLPGRCRALTAVPDGAAPADGLAEVAALVRAVEEEFPDSDPLCRELALQLARKSAGKGPAAVSALKGLAEMVASQRGDPR